jgi:hypothetical protein
MELKEVKRFTDRNSAVTKIRTAAPRRAISQRAIAELSYRPNVAAGVHPESRALPQNAG